MTEFRENKDVRRPFLSTPTPSVYFPGSTIEKARRATSRCLRRDEGVALVVGSTGVGKTLLARVLASEFDADALVAFVSPRRRLDVKSFFQQFLFGLRQTFCGCDETELRLMALDYLERASQERCVLLVDDAQNLTLRVFDEIRGLIDQCAASTTRLSVALFGLGSLEERLNLPSLFPFQQRVVSRAYLENFSRAEITKYVERELKRADVDARFSKSAIEQIAKLSDGSPRVVNQLCDRALFLAFGGEENESDSLKKRHTERVEIEQRDVERAWARLQSLPEEEDAEEEIESIGTGSNSIVEFGILDDDETDEYNNESATSKNVSAAEIATEETAPTSEEVVAEKAFEEVDVLQDEAQVDASTDELKEGAEPSAAPYVFVPKPFDWEADRYGSLEDVAPKQTVETSVDASSPSEETPSEDVEPTVGEESAVDANVEEESVVAPVVEQERDAELNAATCETVENVEATPISQEESADNLTQEARRMRAKRAFWGGDDDRDDDAQDAFPTTRNASGSSVDLNGEKNEQEKAEQEKIEQAEEFEELESEGEIDYELDARLREKFGATTESEPSPNSNEPTEEAKEEPVEELLPPEIDLDGIRFEPRGGAEFVAPSDSSKSIAKRARKTLRPRSYLSAKLSARSVHTLETSEETQDVAPTSETPEAETFDSSLELTAGSVATELPPKSKTRRPLKADDDGSRQYREFNGFDAEDGARFAADDRHLESQFAALPQDSPLRSWGASDENKKEAEAQTPDERAYRQIVASCYRSAADFPSSAQYLNELQLLEEEIAEEANLIRRIRNIHLRLRSMRSPGSVDSNAELSEPSAFVAK